MKERCLRKKALGKFDEKRVRHVIKKRREGEGVRFVYFPRKSNGSLYTI